MQTLTEKTSLFLQLNYIQKQCPYITLLQSYFCHPVSYSVAVTIDDQGLSLRQNIVLTK